MDSSDPPRDDRVLGPEMMAEGWYVIGGDWIMWAHPPSHKTVSLDGPIERQRSFELPAYHGEPSDPATLGYVVLCTMHDELGNPIRSDGYWVASYSEALRGARRTRKNVLGEPPAPAGLQLGLDFDREGKA